MGHESKIHWTQREGAQRTVGEDHGRAKLDHRRVVMIRREYAEGATISLLAKVFGVSRKCIRQVVTRQTWTHLP